MAAILNVYGGATKGALAAEKGGSKLCSAIWMDWDATVQEQQKGLAVEPRSHAEPRGATRSHAERSGAKRRCQELRPAEPPRPAVRAPPP